MKLTKGMKIDDFIFNTGFENDITLKDFANKVQGKTALIFLRYYGCPLCKYDIHLMTKGYDDVLKAGGQITIILQSKPETISSKLKKDSLPFEIICDPEQVLYDKYEILPAKSKLHMADSYVICKIIKAKLAGCNHGEYEGNELQLPAIFIIDKDLNITYSHYAKTITNMPNIKEISELLK